MIEVVGYLNVEATPTTPKLLLIQDDWISPGYEADLLTIGTRKVRDYAKRFLQPHEFPKHTSAASMRANAADREWRNRRALPLLGDVLGGWGRGLAASGVAARDYIRGLNRLDARHPPRLAVNATRHGREGAATAATLRRKDL